ncbi:MAG: DUF6873 family GME fold protein [Anaerovoracaceae bacterium]
MDEIEEEKIYSFDGIRRLGHLSRIGKRTFVSSAAVPEVASYLEKQGRRVIFVTGSDGVEKPVKDHPDMYICRLGISDDSPVIAAAPDEPGAAYPESVAFNAACTGKYFIHNLGYTSDRLIKAAEDHGFSMVDVRQGYTKCSTVIVDEDSVITYDKGIERACSAAGMDVLLIRPGYVRLDGYDTGFIGGASGRIGDAVVFAGDLDDHPDGGAIRDFIEAKGLSVRCCGKGGLVDIGSVI